MRDGNSAEKLALLTLAGVSVVALSAIAVLALQVGPIDPSAAALIGASVAGLIAVGKDTVSAVRAYATNTQLEKVTDQLAASAPVTTEPQPVEVVNADDNPVPTETIKGQV